MKKFNEIKLVCYCNKPRIQFLSNNKIRLLDAITVVPYDNNFDEKNMTKFFNIIRNKKIEVTFREIEEEEGK